MGEEHNFCIKPNLFTMCNALVQTYANIPHIRGSSQKSHDHGLYHHTHTLFHHIRLHNNLEIGHRDKGHGHDHPYIYRTLPQMSEKLKIILN